MTVPEPTDPPTVSEVWWSPSKGLIERFDDQTIGTTTQSGSRRSIPVLPDDAVRLVPAAGPTDPPGDAEGRSGTPGEDSTGELRALRTVEKLSMDRDRLDAAIKAIAARIWSESHVSSRPGQCEALEEIARDLRDLARRPAETPTPPGEVDHG